jgi:hypothetical protein
MKILTLIDTLAIQNYVFISNRLRDIIAGSWIVETYTSQDYIQSLAGKETEIVFAGGGNALLIFQNLSEAKEFSAEYSRSLLDDAPSLRIAVVHLEYDKGSFGQTFHDIQIRMQQEKMQQAVSSPLLGISVNDRCQETGLPASAIIRGAAVSTEIARRRGMSEKTDIDERWMVHVPKDWQSSVGCDDKHRVAFPKDLDDLGRSRSELSQIGVIHVDGNRIGERLNNLVRDWAASGIDDDEIIKRIRTVSSGLTNGLTLILNKLVSTVLGAIHMSGDRDFLLEAHGSDNGFELQTEGKTLFLPIRPVLRAGDDITLIVDARIALSLAEVAIRSFQEMDIPYLTDATPITACAGVAIGGVHSPLYRAYERSEELCRSAKSWAKLNNHDGGCIDWNIDYSNAIRPLAMVRTRDYGPITDKKMHEYQFTLRPYPLEGDFETGHYSWEWLSKCVLSQEEPGLLSDIWQRHRSKLLELRDIVRDGPEVVKSRLTAWRVTNKDLRFPEGIEDGFVGLQTPILDALELLELWIPLDGGGCS